MAFYIRSAVDEDTPALAGLIARSYRDVALRFHLTPENCPKHPSNCTQEWIIRDMARGVIYFILESAAGPQGCVALEIPQPGEGYLERLAVHPQCRHRGYGALLVRHIFSEARSRGVKRLGIGIISAQNELKQWYQNLGFIAGQTRCFQHLPFEVLFMHRSLKGP